VLGDLLARDFANYYAANLTVSGIGLPEAIIPVPLHPSRLRQRGFNQARLLAKTVSRKTTVPLLDRLIVRVVDTQPQATLNAVSRHKNLACAFRSKNSKRGWLPQHVAVIDDVVTTTATARGIATHCLTLGIEQVDIWAVARTFRQ